MEAYDPTIEDSYTRQVSTEEGEVWRISLLDTAGQEEFTPLRDQWIRESEGFAIIYSITNKISFEQTSTFLDQINRVKCEENSVPIALVGNKNDLEEQREVSTQEAHSFATMEGIDFFEASAKKKFNIEESIFNLVKKINQSRTPKKVKKTPKCNIL